MMMIYIYIYTYNEAPCNNDNNDDDNDDDDDTIQLTPKSKIYLILTFKISLREENGKKKECL